MSSLEVAVIGVGTGGVFGLKWCKQRGMKVTGFDKESICGGIWRHGTQHSPAYDSLYTNSSGIMMSIGDYEKPMTSKFPYHQETCKYYSEYMDRNDLNKLVMWNTCVDKVYKQDERWIVEYHDVKTGENALRSFDRVIIATGRLWDPEYPVWASPGSLPASTRIDVIHSRDYRNPVRFANKRVVIVGVGNSALDISLELARDPKVIKPILVSCRRGTVVMPIDDARGEPADYVLVSRAFQYLATPAARLHIMIENAKDINKQFQSFGLPPPPNQQNLFALENPASNLKDSRGYIKALKQGLIKFVDGVTGFKGENSMETGSGVNLDNIDSVILATGFRVGMNFLDSKVRSKVVRTVVQKNGRQAEYVDLFKSMLYPHDPTIGFIVYLTSYGNESIVGSMQARWLTKFWIDKEFARRTFSLEKFRKESATKSKMTIESNTPNPYFVRYLPYMDDLAKDLGAMPDIRAMMKNPLQWGLAFRLMFGPALATQWYLTGDDANPGAVDLFSKL
jgi:dimethylaniline monooxygenase (N-oxide forming)